MINALGYKVDPNGHVGEQQQQARRAAESIFTKAELEALRKLVEEAARCD
jgi:hypothetical protein